MPDRVEHLALLLDLDGTLVDSEPVHRQMYVDWFTARGWPVDPGQLARFTGRRAEDVFASDSGPWTGQDPVALLREAVAYFPADALPLAMPGASALVASARHARPIALVTSAGAPWVARCLGEVLGVLDAFDVIVTNADVQFGKPHPEGYALACTRLEVLAADCLAVEDSPAGIRSAREAGVGTVVGITSTFTEAELSAAGAHRVVAGLDEVSALLR
ncbi:MAG: HAD family phosphatase [Micropruina sp.]